MSSIADRNSGKSLRAKSDLYRYQVYMAKAIKAKRTVLLSVDMGLGKTGATLTAVARLLKEFMIRKVLIIGPKYVAQETWPEEIGTWEHTHRIPYTVIKGTPAQRKKALSEKTKIHIINRENLPWLWSELGKSKFDYDMIVYDESSRLKAGKKRTKTKKLSEFGALAKMRGSVDYVVELTGTVAPNGLKDMWGQSYILDLGERLGASRTSFEDRWFDKDYMGWDLTPKAHAEREIMGRMKDVMIGLRAEDHLKLPEIVPNDLYVDLPPKALKEYKKFERTLVAESYDVEAVSRGVLTNKLLQFANGSLYREIEESWPRKRELVEVHDAKIAALESVMQEANGNPVLLAYSFQFDIEKIRRKFPKVVVVGQSDDDDWKKRWDSGSIPLLAAHPASIGHGLNLQYGGHISCWYGLTWSLELYQQFSQRLPRPGQKAPFVTQHHILARGTVDCDVLDVLKQKEVTQEAVTDTVRKRLLSVNVC